MLEIFIQNSFYRVEKACSKMISVSFYQHINVFVGYLMVWEELQFFFLRSALLA